jgi:hypothetical protein
VKTFAPEGSGAKICRWILYIIIFCDKNVTAYGWNIIALRYSKAILLGEKIFALLYRKAVQF